MKRVLTGIQPSGVPHIGNFFGAIRQVLELQKMGESFVFIADLHSLTTSPKAEDLRERVKRLAVDFLACGLDPETQSCCTLIILNIISKDI